MSGIEEPLVRKTPNVCGGEARIRNTRIPVWLLVGYREDGAGDALLLEMYPSLTSSDLDAAWEYYREHPVEIDQANWFNETAANVPEGTPPPTWVVVSGMLLGLSGDAIRAAFDPTFRPRTSPIPGS